jgi:hypothetical protein
MAAATTAVTPAIKAEIDIEAAGMGMVGRTSGLAAIFMEASTDGGYVWNGSQFIWSAEGSRRSASGVPKGVITPRGFGTSRPGFGVSREQAEVRAHISFQPFIPTPASIYPPPKDIEEAVDSRQFIERSQCKCDSDCEILNDCCRDYILLCSRR